MIVSNGLTNFIHRNFDTEIAFLIPAIIDQQFKKAQIFCNSRFLSDLVGKLE